MVPMSFSDRESQVALDNLISSGNENLKYVLESYKRNEHSKVHMP